MVVGRGCWGFHSVRAAWSRPAFKVHYVAQNPRVQVPSLSNMLRFVPLESTPLCFACFFKHPHKEAQHTDSFTPLPAAPLKELQRSSIHTRKYGWKKSEGKGEFAALSLRGKVTIEVFIERRKRTGSCLVIGLEMFIVFSPKKAFWEGNDRQWAPKSPAVWNLYESAKYESWRCGCQTSLSCVAKRAPSTGTAWAAHSGGVECLGWLYSTARQIWLDATLASPQAGWSAFISCCHLLAPRACDLCSHQLQLHLVNCGYAGKSPVLFAPPTLVMK